VLSFIILGLLILTTIDLKSKGNEMGTTVDSMSNDINSEISQINSDISNMQSNINYIVSVMKQYIPEPPSELTN